MDQLYVQRAAVTSLILTQLNVSARNDPTIWQNALQIEMYELNLDPDKQILRTRQELLTGEQLLRTSVSANVLESRFQQAVNEINSPRRHFQWRNKILPSVSDET